MAPRCSCVNIINVMQHGPAVADTVGTPLYASFDQEPQIRFNTKNIKQILAKFMKILFK